MVRWLIVCLPMQGTWVQSLVQEDTICHGAPRACAPQQEELPQWEAHTLWWKVTPICHNWKKAVCSTKGPVQPKLNEEINNFCKIAKEKQLIMYKETHTRSSADFLAEAMQSQREWPDIFKVMKVKNHNQKYSTWQGFHSDLMERSNNLQRSKI